MDETPGTHPRWIIRGRFVRIEAVTSDCDAEMFVEYRYERTSSSRGNGTFRRSRIEPLQCMPYDEFLRLFRPI